MPRLRRSDANRPGYTRTGRGRGFAYYDTSGNLVGDADELERIRALVIPPAWADVWICPWPNGHIQAMGTDASGRRQYRYHDAWRRQRDREKFDHMIDFARALPGLRDACARHLGGEDLSYDRVFACAVRLLDLGFFRIGTEGYAEENQSYGLATIRKEHVSLHGDGSVEFDYATKSGKQRLCTVADPDIHDVISALRRRRGGGPELLAYREGRRWRDVRSDQINAWIGDATGGDFTAKDFRTWTATVLAAVALAVSTEARSDSARKRAVARAMAEAAAYLGNTPAVCRSSYVDPRVVDRYYDGETIRPVLDRLGVGEGTSVQGEVEEAVLDLLTSGEPAAEGKAA